MSFSTFNMLTNFNITIFKINFSPLDKLVKTIGIMIDVTLSSIIMLSLSFFPVRCHCYSIPSIKSVIKHVTSLSFSIWTL